MITIKDGLKPMHKSKAADIIPFIHSNKTQSIYYISFIYDEH